jgi:hypothetical protein
MTVPITQLKLRAVIHRPNIRDGGTNAETIR